MTDEAHHIARQAAALDDPSLKQEPDWAAIYADLRRRVRDGVDAALAAMDTPKGGGDE